jgi:hypothetical protein
MKTHHVALLAVVVGVVAYGAFAYFYDYWPFA